VITLTNMENTKGFNEQNNAEQVLAAGIEGKNSSEQHKAHWPDDALIILPLRNAVLFPWTLAPLSFGRKVSTAAVE